jgi:hypothetical protein
MHWSTYLDSWFRVLRFDLKSESDLFCHSSLRSQLLTSGTRWLPFFQLEIPVTISFYSSVYGRNLVEVLCYKLEGRGSIPHDVFEFFNWPNPSSRTMALRSAQPLTEMSTRIFLGVNDGRCVRLTTSAPSVSRLSRKCGEPRRVTTLRASKACYRDSLNFFTFMEGVL